VSRAGDRVVDGLARLVNPTACIGHGACVAACPFDAIQLVFGTEKRGVDIPQVGPDFQTNVPGVFISGRAGRHGAHSQSRRARPARRGEHQRAARNVERARPGDRRRRAGGSHGVARAKERGLRHVLLEQESSLGGSILHYPRRKVAMTSPMELPLVGRVAWREIRKEALVEFWTDVVRKQKLSVQFSEPMMGIERDGQGFVVPTPRHCYRARNVLLSLGRRGTPRKLKCRARSCEDGVSPRRRSAIPRPPRAVAGGGDSAIEAALALAAEPGTQVALSYRGAAFDRVKPKNRQRLESTPASGASRIERRADRASKRRARATRPAGQPSQRRRPGLCGRRAADRDAEVNRHPRGDSFRTAPARLLS